MSSLDIPRIGYFLILKSTEKRSQPVRYDKLQILLHEIRGSTHQDMCKTVQNPWNTWSNPAHHIKYVDDPKAANIPSAQKTRRHCNARKSTLTSNLEAASALVMMQTWCKLDRGCTEVSSLRCIFRIKFRFYDTEIQEQWHCMTIPNAKITKVMTSKIKSSDIVSPFQMLRASPEQSPPPFFMTRANIHTFMHINIARECRSLSFKLMRVLSAHSLHNSCCSLMWDYMTRCPK
jgi:hypothetical protein